MLIPIEKSTRKSKRSINTQRNWRKDKYNEIQKRRGMGGLKKLKELGKFFVKIEGLQLHCRCVMAAIGVGHWKGRFRFQKPCFSNGK